MDMVRLSVTTRPNNVKLLLECNKKAQSNMNPLYYLLKHHLLFKARLTVDSIDQKSFLGFFKEWQ